MALVSLIANHLWQSTVFTCAAALLTLALRGNSARVRYWIWVAASLKFLLPFSVLIAWGGQVPWRSAPVASPARLSIALDQASQPFTISTASSASFASQPAESLPLILATIWAIGFLGIGCTAWLRWSRIRSAVRAGSRVPLGLSVPAIASSSFLEPGVFGVFRPVLLLPAGFFEHLSPQQQDAVIAHELCHVRRRDNLIGAVQMFVEAVFWFHPMVWWIGRQILREKERGCDQEVLRLGSEPGTYAQSILKVCELYLESPVACMSGVSGSDLRSRIQEILSHRAAVRMGAMKRIALAASALAALATPILVGHLRAQPVAYEVSSVKASPPGNVRDTGGIQMRFTAGGFTASNAGLVDLVTRAYNLDEWQVLGGPEWSRPKGMSNDDRFVVDAKSASKATIAESRRMLQTLLADRFKLQFHHESKTQTVYDLVVAKGGPKMQAIKVDDYQGNLITRCCRGGMYMDRTTMADFASSFTLLGVHTTVRDRTGLKGVYKFELHWSPEEFRSGEKQDSAANGEQAFERDAPSLAEAMRQQLGLALVAAKGPVEFMVIDHAEKPSGN